MATHREPAAALRDERLLRWAFTIAALLALSLCMRQGALLPDKPFTEDGYYLLAVSRQLALGNGLSIDGVHPTNGVQPLFTVLAALAYLPFGEDRLAPLRLVALLQGAVLVLAALWFGIVVRDAGGGDPAAGGRRRWLASLVYLSAGYLWMIHQNGLETGLALLCYLGCFRLQQRLPLRGLARAAAHGALLGALVLARIDASFFVAALCALHWLTRGPEADASRRRRLAEAVVLGATAVAVSSPWWLYNKLEFGAFMPTSGTAQMAGPGGGGFAEHAASRVLGMADALLLVATPSLYVPGGSGGAAGLAVRIALLAAIAILVWRSRREAARAPANARLFVIALLLAAAGWIVWYAGFFWAVHFYGRYLAPLALLGAAAAARALAFAVERAPRLGWTLAVCLWLQALGFAALCHTGRGFGGSEWYRDQLALVAERVPAAAKVAAGQSGTLGYFRDRVVNLDGKVNPEALRRSGDMPAYLEELGVRWCCDWPEYVHMYFGPDPTVHGWQRVASRSRFQLWQRR